jgi:hypothetical protein
MDSLGPGSIFIHINIEAGAHFNNFAFCGTIIICLCFRSW